MRSVFALSALLIVATTGSTMARDYPWCARTLSNGFNGDCSFTSFRQCMATVSGQGGDCMANPRMAYGQSRRGNRPVQPYGSWDNRW